MDGGQHVIHHSSRYSSHILPPGSARGSAVTLAREPEARGANRSTGFGSRPRSFGYRSATSTPMVEDAELPSLSRRADIMAMPAAVRRYTVAEVLAFPEDGNRYELIRGELHVSPAPAPRHQVVVGRLYWELAQYLNPLGRRDTLFTAPADIFWDDETLVQPDLLVVSPEELSNSWTTFRTLVLAAEVLSPSSPRRDRVDKRRCTRSNVLRPTGSSTTKQGSSRCGIRTTNGPRSRPKRSPGKSHRTLLSSRSISLSCSPGYPDRGRAPIECKSSV